MQECKLALLNDMARNCVLESTAERLLSKLKEAEKTYVESRKFVVLKNEKTMYLAVGPVFVDGKNNPSYYLHRDLRQAVLHFLDRDGRKRYQISGGGQIALKYETFMGGEGWVVHLGGSSSDYGPYDPAVLLEHNAVADWFGLETRFRWEDRAYPTRKK